MLEAALGKPLFERKGRRIRLNSTGTALLAAVRDAMRRIDDTTDVGPRRLRVSAHSAWLALLVPVIDGLELEDVVVDSIPSALMRGSIDLAIGSQVEPAEGLLVERLGVVRHAVCRQAAAPESFAVCGVDAWPPERPRTIAMRSLRLEAVIDACASGAASAVLPVPIARARRIRMLRKPVLAATELYLVRRQPLGTSGFDEVVAEIRVRAARVLA